MGFGVNREQAILIDSESDDESTQDSDSQLGVNFKYPKGGLAGWKDRFARQLNGIQTVGDFATSQHSTCFANPGLEVAGTVFSLPLTAHDAEIIKGTCKQAPFGRGDETLVDESVRKTWELDHHQFRLVNPAWPQFFEQVCQHASDSLAMPGVRVEPYKLLLYEEGSFFKRHKDSEKVAGMIGTLVICLPSKHEGGDVHLSLGDKQKTFHTSTASAFDLTTLAWFSDVTHEITKLTSGHRLVLTYNIIKDREDIPSPLALVKQQEDLGRMLSSLRHPFVSVDRLLYALDHKYTESSLSLRNMKGRDRAVCYSLEQQCRENDCFLLLANLTKTREPEEDYYGANSDEEDDDDDDGSLTLDCIFTCGGDRIATNMDVVPSDILDFEPYAPRDADSEDEGDFTGNESRPSTFRYHDSVALIIPKQYLHKLLGQADSGLGAETMLKMVINDLSDNANNLDTQESALDFMAKVVSMPKSIFGTGLATVVRWATKFSRQDLVQSATSKSVRLQDTAPVIKALTTIINNDFAEKNELPKWGDCLHGFLTASSHGTQAGRIMQDFGSQLDKRLQANFIAWQGSRLEEQLEKAPSLKRADLEFVTGLIESHWGDAVWTSSKLIPSLIDRGDKQLVCALATNLLKSSQQGHKTERKNMAQAILDSADCKLPPTMTDFASYSGWSNPMRHTSLHQAGQSLTQYQMEFLQLIDLCFTHHLTETAVALLDVAANSLLEARSDWPAFVNSAGDFLRTILEIFSKHHRPLPTTVKNLWATLFRTYVIGTVPARPTKMPGLRCRPRGCGCQDCHSLDIFLQSESQKVFTLKAAEKRRTHFYHRLSDYVFKKSTDTRSGSPYTLTVTKIPGAEFEQDVADYSKKIGQIQDRVMPYQHLEAIQSLLGDDLFGELVMLNKIDDRSAPSMLGAKRPATEELANPGSTRPRLV